MRPFDRILIVDWSARAKPSPRRPSKDSIWLYEAGAGDPGPVYCRTRHDAMIEVTARIEAALQDGARLLAGWDFPFGYPAGFAEAVMGKADALALWKTLADRIQDGPDNANNRFKVAAALNRETPGAGPFWGCPARAASDDLTEKKPAGSAFPERRLVETRARGAQPCWKLFTTGSVGSQALLGLPRLQALRERFGDNLRVWPFEDAAEAAIVLAEVYPSLLDTAVSAALARDPGAIKDAVQVEVLARALIGLEPHGMAQALAAAEGPALAEEGWVLGVGVEEELRRMA